MAEYPPYDPYMEEQEALSRGLTVEQLRNIKRLEEEARREREQRAREIYAQWQRESEDCRTKYPSFSLDSECKRPDTGRKFVSLLKAGADVTSAYEVVHLSEIKGKKKQSNSSILLLTACLILGALLISSRGEIKELESDVSRLNSSLREAKLEAYGGNVVPYSTVDNIKTTETAGEPPARPAAFPENGAEWELTKEQEEIANAVIEKHQVEELSPVAFPENGTVKARARIESNETLAPFKITVPSSHEYFYIALCNAASGEKEIGVYLDSGSTVEVEVPLGNYTLYYCSGDVWYGEAVLFGADGSYAKTDDIFSFYEDGDYVYYNEVTLYPVSNGNLDTEDIEYADFPV